MAVALIRPLAWEIPYAAGAVLIRKRKRKKKKERLDPCCPFLSNFRASEPLA